MSNTTIIKPQPGQKEKFLASSADAVIFRRTYREVMKEGGFWDSCREIYPLAGGIFVFTKYASFALIGLVVLVFVAAFIARRGNACE